MNIRIIIFICNNFCTYIYISTQTVPLNTKPVTSLGVNTLALVKETILGVS
jgi:hypothetical protein